MDLPHFKYHPDPLRSGSVVKKSTHCRCCGKDVEYIYIGPVYCRESLHEQLCPWCIATGAAHAKFDAVFADDYPLAVAGVPSASIEEVTQRTPGYVSWQQESWASHCGDACAFVGDASSEVLRNLPPSIRQEIFGVELSDQEWMDFVAHYHPGEDPAIYHFECLKCGRQVFNYDCS